MRKKASLFKTVRIRKLVVGIGIYFILICIAFIIVYPFFIKLFSSLRSTEDLFDYSIQLIPKNFSLEQFATVFERMEYPIALANSIILCLLVSALQVFSASCIGYGLAKFQFLGKKLLYFFMIVTLLIPAQTTMTAMFLQFRYFDVFGIISLFSGHSLNLIDTLWPFALLAVTGLGLKNGLYIYLSIQSFRGLPKELAEAAQVDGANQIGIFFRIMLPNVRPVMMTVFLFSFCWQWTDAYYSGLFMNDFDLLAQNIYHVLNMGNNGNVDQIYMSALTNAALLLVIIPLVVLYIFCQKSFIQGLEKSGIVG